MKRRLLIISFTVTIIIGFTCLSFADKRVDNKTLRGKSASADLLPEELKSVNVEDYFIESKESPVGTIQKTSGHVVVLHKDSNKAYYAITGDTVYQQDVFYTLKDSRCRIGFKTEDIITMGENGKIIVEEVSEDIAAGEKKSVMSMLKGKAMFYVMRLFKYKRISASVKTPTAVMGVRGTKFGVEVRKAGEKIADLSDESLIYLANNESGNYETVIYGFDGSVDVTSLADGSINSVGAGESLFVDNLGAGNVGPVNPDIANQFIQQTEGGGFVLSRLLAPGAVEAGNLISSIGNLVDVDNIISTVDPNTYLEDVSQNITGSVIEDQAEHELGLSVPNVPANRIGYFTGMLTVNISLAMVYADTYVSPSLQNLANPDAEAVAGSYSMKIDASAGMSDVKLTNLETPDDTISGSYPAGFTKLGNSNYMEWGYWTQPQPMAGSFDTYYVDNPGYYIVGDPTSSTDMMALYNTSGTWTYSGAALGNYWTSTGGVPMAGTFNCNVDFMNGVVYNYDLNVSGGAHSAGVTGADGVLTPGSPQFQLGAGTATIDGYSATFSANASFYGPMAAEMGGAWKIDAQQLGGNASGIFTGTKQ